MTFSSTVTILNCYFFNMFLFGCKRAASTKQKANICFVSFLLFVRSLQFSVFFQPSTLPFERFESSQGERATSDISSCAHLINKWINYARFMGWCTSKHFKGHGECPRGAVMRGSSAQRQIWWPRLVWTWSFSHFVCSLSCQSLCCFFLFFFSHLLPHMLFSSSFFFFFPVSHLLNLFHLSP